MIATKYKAIPITLFGVTYYDKILFGKMFMIDLHFHNIYINYQRFFELRKREIEDEIIRDNCSKIKYVVKYFDKTRENNEIDKQKGKYLRRIRKEIKYIRKYLMKEEYKDKLLFSYESDEIDFIFSNYQKLIAFSYSGYLSYDLIRSIMLRQKKYRKKLCHGDIIKYQRYISLRKDEKEILKEIREIVEDFESYFKEKDIIIHWETDSDSDSVSDS